MGYSPAGFHSVIYESIWHGKTAVPHPAPNAYKAVGPKFPPEPAAFGETSTGPEVSSPLKPGAVQGFGFWVVCGYPGIDAATPVRPPDLQPENNPKPYVNKTPKPLHPKP